MDRNGSKIVQIVAANYNMEATDDYQYFVVPYGLNIANEDQVEYYWIHANALFIKLNVDFVQDCPKYGCEVVHNKGQVIEVNAFDTIHSRKPSLADMPNEIDIVEKTTEHLMRIYNSTKRGKPHVRVPGDFPHWDRIACDIYDMVSEFVPLFYAWTRNEGHVLGEVVESHL